jgi:uncharacterized protein with NRDE domain
MCLLALLYRVADDAPIIVGANREEAYERGGDPPRLLPGPMRIAAGVDPRAGGTWLGVNERGVLVAVTNRPRSHVPPQPRSRGLLALDLLGCVSARAAAEQAARELGTDRYGGCNVLCVDSDSAAIIQAGDWLRVRPLSPGLHVLTARDINDVTDRRLAFALDWLGQRPLDSAALCITALQELCARRDEPPICLHSERGGTVSSSILALRSPLARGTYLHAQGPPDTTPYADYSHLLRELASGGQGA